MDQVAEVAVLRKVAPGEPMIDFGCLLSGETGGSAQVVRVTKVFPMHEIFEPVDETFLELSWGHFQYSSGSMVLFIGDLIS